MDWFYADGGRQNGPVSDSQLDDLLRSGKISISTLVWREGLSQWQPLNAARAGTSGLVCVECGKSFPPDEIITLNNSPVCAQCKPVFLQRMAENAPIPSSGNVWRYNKRLVTRNETVLPDRCVKCNAPANGFRLKRTLYWAHPAYLLLLLLNVLILIIVYLIVRKKAVVQIGFCDYHRTKRTRCIAAAWSCFGLGIVLFICSAMFNSTALLVIGLLVFIVGSITFGIMARTVAPTKIDKEYVWLSGVNPNYLAELPEWTGPK